MNYIQPIQFDREKFKSVVHYVCASCEADKLGAVKLNKVLYFSDMLHFAFHGSPITGSPYRKRPRGPTSDYIPGALRDLERSGAVRVEDVNYFGYWKKQYSSLANPDISQLTDSEKNLLDEVIDFVCRSNTAKTISEFSHNAAWERAAWGAELPYHTAFYLLPSEVSEEAKEWGMQEVKALEAARQGNKPVERRSFEAFRNSVLSARGETP